MKHRAFIELVAKGCGVPRKTVALFARNLKEAGLLTTGARGVNAPEMTLIDLTRMIIALCATDRPAEAVEKTNFFRQARTFEAHSFKAGENDIEVPAGMEAEDFFGAMLGLPFFVLKRSGLEIRLQQQRFFLEIRIFDVVILFSSNHLVEHPTDGAVIPNRGITTTRGIEIDSLSEMALPFELETASGARWEEIVETGNFKELTHQHIFKLPCKADGGDT
jgi:hypothetical protein